MSHKRDISLVLLVGIPGSGKSFFRSFLENYCKENSTVLGSVQMFSVCYDDYCKVRNPMEFGNSVNWKEERHNILKDVENIVVQIIGKDTYNLEHSFRDISLVNGHLNVPSSSLIVIDDNMYYRSMRYEYFKIAKTYRLGFCQLFFNVTLDKALKCNNQRRPDSKVPEDIILTMFNKIEPPDLHNSWEKNSLSITSYMDFDDKHFLDDIFILIKGALSNPVVVSEHSLDTAQRNTNLNTLHQIDNILKQLVGNLIKKQIVERDEFGNVQRLSKEFSNKRLCLLKEIKDGVVPLPLDLSEPFNYDDLNLVKQTLLELLQQR